MLIPLIGGKRKSKKDMSPAELKDFETSEKIATAQPKPKTVFNKHPGLKQPKPALKEVKKNGS